VHAEWPSLFSFLEDNQLTSLREKRLSFLFFFLFLKLVVFLFHVCQFCLLTVHRQQGTHFSSLKRSRDPFFHVSGIEEWFARLLSFSPSGTRSKCSPAPPTLSSVSRLLLALHEVRTPFHCPLFFTFLTKNKNPISSIFPKYFFLALDRGAEGRQSLLPFSLYGFRQ